MKEPSIMGSVLIWMEWRRASRERPLAAPLSLRAQRSNPAPGSLGWSRLLRRFAPRNDRCHENSPLSGFPYAASALGSRVT